jgi:hypothetical protein
MFGQAGRIDALRRLTAPDGGIVNSDAGRIRFSF